MTTFADLFSKKKLGPLTKPLRAKVVAHGEIVKYTVSSEERQCLHVAISDGETVVKCLVYDATKFSRFKAGNSVVLRDIITKVEDNVQTVVVTKTTKVFLTTPIQVPVGHENEGQHLLNPPAAEVKSIKEALTSPSKTKVSVQGKVVQEDDEKTVKVRGEEVSIKTITIEDESGRSKVTMWRDVINRKVRPEDFVLVTNVVTNTFRQETSLSTTQKSTVEKSEAPLTEENVIVVGVCLENGNAELLLEDDTSVNVPSELLLNVAPKELVLGITYSCRTS